MNELIWQAQSGDKRAMSEIIDDNSISGGIETRIESFIDIISIHNT